MEKLDNIKEVKVGEQQTEIDPRSKTTADKSFNYIGTGGPEMEVKGQGKVLAEKKRSSRSRCSTSREEKKIKGVLICGSVLLN